MPFHSDITMETINDIFPPLDPPLGPDMDAHSFMGMSNGMLESSFPALSPSPATMADSMLDDSDDLNTLALGEHPFMEITSGIHIKQEYEDDDETAPASFVTSSPSNIVKNGTDIIMKPPTTTVAMTTIKSSPSSIRGLLQRPTAMATSVMANGKAQVNGVETVNGALLNARRLQLERGLLMNSELQNLLNGHQEIKQEPKDEIEATMSDDNSHQFSGGDDDDEEDEEEEEDPDVDDEDDLTAESIISSTVSSAISSAVSSAAATPVVSPAQSPGPVVTPGQGHGLLQGHLTQGHTDKGHGAAGARAAAAATAAAQNGTHWSSGREKRTNRWATSAANYGKVERKELRKRKPTSYALLKEDPLPSKKKRSYNFRQFRRTIEMSFSSEGEKQEFDESLECLKQWANMKTVTQFLQFAMKQLQELRSQGQSLIVDPPQKSRSKKKSKRFSPDQSISPADAQGVEIFATCTPSLQHLVNQVHEMGARRLPCPRISLHQRDMHVGILRLENGEETNTWKSSPYLQGSEDYLVNYRLAVGMLASGISCQTYERFSQGASFGAMKSTFLEEKCLPGVSAAVGKAVQESTDGAVGDVLQNRPTGTEIETHVETSVVNEKRHTTVLAMDTESSKILGSVIITKNEDMATKNNEGKDDDVVGSQKLLRNLMEKGVAIRNRNTGSTNNKVANGNSNGAPFPVDEHMIWKAIRDDLKNYSSITSGLQKDMGRTWHPELADKEDSIRKQLYRSLRFSNGDSNFLRRGLCAIPRHYQGSHDLCHTSSPCRQGLASNPSHDRIKDIKALQILTVYIQHMNLYRYPTMILEHIKSTNHRQPPKISLRSFCGDGGTTSIPLHNLRTGLYVLWWNENSLIIGSQSHATLDNVPTTCHYAHEIWKKFLAKVV